MDVGAAMLFTDYSMGAGELAQALEARGFESMWAPEHSHIPVPRRTPFPGGGELPKPYYEVMDPFVVLSAAAVVTKYLKLATGVCLVVQRDPIQTAKPGASVDAPPDRRDLCSRREGPRSTRSPAGAFCSGSAAAGTARRSRATAPPLQPASS